MSSRLLAALMLIALGLNSASCTGGTSSSGVPPLPLNEGSLLTGPAGTPAAQPLVALPRDAQQPWETRDQDGFVLDADIPGRAVSSINSATDFTPGVERFLDSGDIAANGEALRLNGSDASGSSYAMYRVSMQAQQPGVVSIDANLLSSSSQYYVAVSNYGSGRWQWAGPFSDSHVRLPVETDGSGDYTSSLGNTFISVLVNSGSSIDIVGVGVNQFDPVDTQAPATPLGLTLAPVNGGIELTWSPVLEPDLAGYAIYFSSKSFISPDSAGVHSVPYLEGSTRHLLSGLTAETFVAVAAVDFTGNKSLPSSLKSAAPLVAVPGSVTLTGSAASGGINDAVTLSASGGDLYDWDLDGDGVFEITDDATGSQTANTSATGIVRPAVRSHDSGGEAVALGGLSLLIIGNSRPTASATANPQSGPAPLDVTFTGIAEDNEDDASALTFAWDFDGDGIYDTGTDTQTPDVQTYDSAGTWNAKFRVTDSGGAWDLDTVAIAIGEGLRGWPTANLQVSPDSSEKNSPFIFDASGSIDPGGAITNFEWDTDFDGIFSESSNGEDALAGQAMVQLSWPQAGEYRVAVQVSDANGHTATVQISVTVHGWLITNLQTAESVALRSNLLIVDGLPAVFYSDNNYDELLYKRALNPEGTAWGPSIQVDTNCFLRSGHSAFIVGGRPAIAYSGPGSPGLFFCQAQDTSGSSWGSRQMLDPACGAANGIAVGHVAGNPAIAYHDSVGQRLRFLRAVDSTSSAWNNPVDVDNLNDPGTECSLAIVNGYPAISYQLFSGLDLAYVRAQDATGSSWGIRIILDTTDDTGYTSSLLVVDGAPAIAYQNRSLTKLLYIRAADADGNSWNTTIDTDGTDSTGWSPTLFMLDGLPQIVCFRSSPSALTLRSASDVGGSVWAPLFKIESTVNIGQEPSGVTFIGRPAISYYDGVSQPNSDIRFAIRY